MSEQPQQEGEQNDRKEVDAALDQLQALLRVIVRDLRGQPHPLLDMLQIDIRNAQYVCESLRPEHLPRHAKRSASDRAHIRLERVLAADLLRVAGIARVLVEQLLALEKLASTEDVDILKRQVVIALEHPQFRQRASEVLRGAASYKEKA